MDWLSILILIAIAAAVVLALRAMRKHPAACGGCCDHCPGGCGRKKQQAEEET